MSGIIDQTIQKSLQMTLGRVQTFSSALANASAPSRSRSFKQWQDFNQPQVQHVHVQYLEWLYGSVYRKHTRHVLLLYDFDVAQTQLKDAHQTALNAFTLDVIFPHYLNVVREHQGFPRHFEHYPSPFAVNVSMAQKNSLLLRQPWIGDIGRDKALKYSETESFRTGALHDRVNDFNTFWPVLDPNTSVDDLQRLEPNEAKIFVDNSASPMPVLYRPFLIDKLLNTGPAPASELYPLSISGHASSTGPDAQNNTLSQLRAQTVVTYLHTLLSDHCAEFANVNPDLATNVKALGSQAPIWPVNAEVEENRSVKLVFQTAYDYVYLLNEGDLLNAYNHSVTKLHNDLNEYIEHGKAWQRAWDNGEPFTPDALRKGELDKTMREADQQLALGMSTLKFAHRYRSDFASLNNKDAFEGIPPRANSINFFKYRTPEGTTTEQMLPIPFLLQHGVYNKTPTRWFNLPISAANKLTIATEVLTAYIKEYSSQIIADSLDVGGVLNQLNKMGRLIQEDYANFYSKDLITAHSFLLTELPRKQDFEAALDNQETRLPVHYEGKNVDVPILHYRFITKELKRLTLDAPYYWYDQDVLKIQIAAKTQLAPLVLAAHMTFKNLDVHPLLTSGMHMASTSDLYYLLETYFWVRDMK